MASAVSLSPSFPAFIALTSSGVPRVRMVFAWLTLDRETPHCLAASANSIPLDRTSSAAIAAALVLAS